VWQDQVFDSFTNIIDVYINYLRKKVDRDSDKRLIHTVRGVGYVLKDE
jgi:DNA-binding response OmpR family regulator